MLGKVIDVNDPRKLGRLKVRVYGYYDDIAEDLIPWALPKYVGINKFDLPPLNSIVDVEFMGGDVQTPIWKLNGIGKAVTFSDDDYPTATQLLSKVLSEYGDTSGSIDVTFTESLGFNITFVYGDSSNSFILNPDNTIQLINNNSGKQIHISNESISLGSETESAEPAVLGDKNVTALSDLNDTIKANMYKINTQLNTIKAAALTSPYTAHLASPITTSVTAIKTLTDSEFSENDTYFPEILSEIVTLD